MIIMYIIKLTEHLLTRAIWILQTCLIQFVVISLIMMSHPTFLSVSLPSEQSLNYLHQNILFHIPT